MNEGKPDRFELVGTARVGRPTRVTRSANIEVATSTTRQKAKPGAPLDLAKLIAGSHEKLLHDKVPRNV